MVEDLGSKNGTYVNGQALGGPRALRAGDRITAGQIAITYAFDPEPAAPSLVEFGGGGLGSATVVMSLEASSKAIRGAEEDARGRRESSAMQALVRAGLALSENRPLEDLFPVILDLALQAVGAQRGVVMTLEGDALVVRAHKGEGFRISNQVRVKVVEQGESILVRDAQADQEFKASVSIIMQRVRAMMAVPLQTKDRVTGLIYVDDPAGRGEFTSDDLSLLTVMANVAAVRIENARLAEVEEAGRTMRRELAQAAEIQRGMLPAAAPETPGFDLAGYNAACLTVGGDYYDFFPYPGSKVGLALGDVSGKGMPAALMMMALQARVQALAVEPGELGGFMGRLNRATCVNCPGNRFITFVFAMLEGSTGYFALANAGHNPPILVRANGDAQLLESGGPPLGILAMMGYTSICECLAPGDLLAIYSDGVTEAANPAQEEFGEARLMEALRQHRGEPAAAIIQAVTAALAEFCGTAPQTDDITLVVARKL